MTKILCSYDYELLWGVWDTVGSAYVENYVSNANYAASLIIQLHEKYKIKATWAIVSAAIDQNCSIEQRIENTNRSPEEQFKMTEVFKRHKALGAELYDISPGNLNQIKHSEIFEYACHTYGHKYAHTCSKEDLESDLQNVARVETEERSTSMVFPRNVITDDALVSLENANFNTVRVNPQNILYRSIKGKGLQGQVIRALRFADSFVPIQEYLSSAEYSFGEKLNFTEGQYFFRPKCGGKILNFLHRKRLVFGLFYCIKHKKDFHVWSHPHNFGSDPEKSVENLKKLFDTIDLHIANGKAISAKMCEI